MRQRNQSKKGKQETEPRPSIQLDNSSEHTRSYHEISAFEQVPEIDFKTDGWHNIPHCLVDAIEKLKTNMVESNFKLTAARMKLAKLETDHTN